MPVEIGRQFSRENSPWGLSPAAACDVGCVFFWPLQDHCDKSGTGLLRTVAVEIQTDRRLVSFWAGPGTGTPTLLLHADVLQARYVRENTTHTPPARLDPVSLPLYFFLSPYLCSYGAQSLLSPQTPLILFPSFCTTFDSPSFSMKCALYPYCATFSVLLSWTGVYILCITRLLQNCVVTYSSPYSWMSVLYTGFSL